MTLPVTKPLRETDAYCDPSEIVHVGVTDIVEPSEYVALHENCADVPPLTVELPDIEIEDNFLALDAFLV